MHMRVCVVVEKQGGGCANAGEYCRQVHQENTLKCTIRIIVEASRSMKIYKIVYELDT